jgi:hypothetical protein
LAATAKSSFAILGAEDFIPFSRFKSRSIVTLPFSTIIFWSVPVPPSLKLRRTGPPSSGLRLAGWSWLLGLFFVAGLRERASNDVKSKTNESMKLVSVIFDIVLDSPDCDIPLAADTVTVLFLTRWQQK